MDALLNPEIWIALATLTALELVLGIDNIIFISILAGRLPPHQRSKARRVGIAVAAIGFHVVAFSPLVPGLEEHYALV